MGIDPTARRAIQIKFSKDGIVVSCTMHTTVRGVQKWYCGWCMRTLAEKEECSPCPKNPNS